MAGPVLVCTDGSDRSTSAVRAGLDLVRGDLAVVVVTVVDTDPMLVTGTGFAGGTMTPTEFDQLDTELTTEADELVAQLVATLDRGDTTTRVLRGTAGPAICQLADDVDASAIVLGSHGRGGVKRALLGSVSDWVVRNASCPVVVTSHPET